jgi:murein DD-endopeptidase MepM/ murein hydrolase activator NlpD
MKIRIPEENRIFYIIAGAVTVFTVLIFILHPFSKSSEKEKDNTIIPVLTRDEFGVVTDTLQKTENEIKKNETFSKMLVGLGLTPDITQKIIDKTRNEISTTQFQAGVKYYTYYTQQVPKNLKYLVFDFNIKKKVVISISDSIVVDERLEKEEIVKRSVGSKIQGSLFETLDKLGINEALALKLANDIFPSQIDFYKLQEGDSFKVIFDDIQIKGKSIGISKVHAVVFNHRKEDYYAFHFEQAGVNEYYDQKANTLREGYLKSPLRFARISSRFTISRLHPVLGYRRPHLGTDYAAPTGTPILSIGEGIVIEKGFNGGFGNYVKVKHNGSYTTQYAHMSKFAAGIKKGSKVKKSQVIGYVGTTGLSSGPHVDFRFWKSGKLVDHLKEKYPIANPIDKKYKPSFNALKDKLSKELGSITLIENS